MNYFANCCSRLIELLLPQRCALCSHSGGDAAVCAACQPGLPRLPAGSCPRCADFSAAGTLCAHCLAEPPAFDRVLSPFLYAEPVDELIQALKYRHQLHLAGWLGAQIHAAIPVAPANPPPFDVIVPLPLHPARIKQRGFNQALEIARPLARRFDRPLLPTAVTRVRDTTPQAGLPRQERQRNLRGAFECTADLSGQAILLIDDVLTTGSSAGELARVLKLHGARQVVVATAARTQQAA